jgi:antirestriction protein
MSIIKIWLGDLGAYNSGTLRGEWLNLPMDSDELATKIAHYTDNGRGDYFIADSECDVDGITISEYATPQKLNELAETLDDMNDTDQDKLGYLLGDGCDLEQALSELDDLQYYPGVSLQTLAADFVDEGLFGEIPKSIANYIDYDAIARDLGFDGYHETRNGVFRRG